MVEDEEYARELFAILTRPLDPDEPVDSYGTGSDRIDRHGGFGTDVKVTSIDVVPGPYGAEIEVGFVLEVPEGWNVPAVGSCRLPFAAEWREAQGFTNPALHAPWAAMGVERGVRDHVTASRRDRPVNDVPDRDAQWAMLLDLLAGHGDVTETVDGHLVVRRGDRHVVTALLTADEWERVLKKNGTPRPELVDDYEEILAALHEDGDYLVAWEDDLVRSVRPELPPVDGNIRAILRVQAARARGEDPYAGGAWYAYTPVDDEQ